MRDVTGHLSRPRKLSKTRWLVRLRHPLCLSSRYLATPLSSFKYFATTLSCNQCENTFDKGKPLADAEIQRICAKVELISCRYFAPSAKVIYREFAGGFVCGSGQFILKIEEEVEGRRKKKRMAEEDSGSLAETAGEGQLAMTLERN